MSTFIYHMSTIVEISLNGFDSAFNFRLMFKTCPISDRGQPRTDIELDLATDIDPNLIARKEEKAEATYHERPMALLG